eukprot:COSAG05_NODE_1952_length_3792_cov_7.187111_3_plen_198_part_00
MGHPSGIYCFGDGNCAGIVGRGFRYGGSNILTAVELMRETHLKQLFQGHEQLAADMPLAGADPPPPSPPPIAVLDALAVSMGHPSGIYLQKNIFANTERSILGSMLPPAVLYRLGHESAAAAVSQFLDESDTPEVTASPSPRHPSWMPLAYPRGIQVEYTDLFSHAHIYCHTHAHTHTHTHTCMYPCIFKRFAWGDE